MPTTLAMYEVESMHLVTGNQLSPAEMLRLAARLIFDAHRHGSHSLARVVEAIADARPADEVLYLLTITKIDFE